jgi:hypothetical protein
VGLALWAVVVVVALAGVLVALLNPLWLYRSIERVRPGIGLGGEIEEGTFAQLARGVPLSDLPPSEKREATIFLMLVRINAAIVALAFATVALLVLVL